MSPEPPAERRLESRAANTAAAIVEREHDVAVLGEILMEEVAPGIAHALHAGTAVHIDEHRITFAGSEAVRGFSSLYCIACPSAAAIVPNSGVHVLIEIGRIRMRRIELVGLHHRQTGARQTFPQAHALRRVACWRTCRRTRAHPSTSRRCASRRRWSRVAARPERRATPR